MGDDSLSISTIDPSGIALAAIQELNRKNQELTNKVQEIEDLKARLAKLEALVQSWSSNPAQNLSAQPIASQ